MRSASQPPVHPFGRILIGLVAIVVLGVCYLVFDIGKDALTYAFAGLMVFGFPLVVAFGFAGIVVALKRVFRRG